MARLTKAERDALPSSDFADPAHREYPIEDAGHRKAAMGRAAEWAGPALKKKVFGAARRRGFGGKPIDGG